MKTKVQAIGLSPKGKQIVKQTKIWQDAKDSTSVRKDRT